MKSAPAAASEELDREFAEEAGKPPAPAEAGSTLRGQRDLFYLLEALIAVSRNRRLILRCTLAAALASTVAAWLVPNRYTATARILPPQQNQSLAASMLGQLGALGPVAAMAQKDLGLKNPADLYIGMLRSRTVADALIRRFDLQQVYGERRLSDTRRKLENATSIAAGKEGFIGIAVEDRDRGRAARMANAYVEQLRELTQNLAVTEAGQRRLFFEGQLRQAKDSLADAEQALKETEQKTGLIQLDGQAKAIIESVGRLRASIAAKEVELHALRLSATEQNPDLQMREQQLAGLRVQLGLLEKQGEAGNLQVPAGSVPEAGLQYVRRLREVKYSETMFELLARQYEAARLDEAKNGAVIQVLDPALEPDRKSWPPRAWMVALCTLFAGFSAVVWVLAGEAWRRLREQPGVDARWRRLRAALPRTQFESRG